MARSVFGLKTISTSAPSELRLREGCEIEDPVLGRAQALVDNARPEHGVHLRHVGAPERHRVSELDVVVAPRRLVDTEGLHEGRHRRGHAVPGIGVEIVGAPPGLSQLHRRVAFLDEVLAGAHDGDPGWSELAVGALPLALHHIEGFFPAHRHEVARLVELAVLHPEQRPREAVRAVLDLGKGVALDAEEPPVHRARRVALHRDHPPAGARDLDAAAHAAEAADAPVPAPVLVLLGTERRQRQTRRPHYRGCESRLEKFPACQFPAHASLLAVGASGGAAAGECPDMSGSAEFA